MNALVKTQFRFARGQSRGNSEECGAAVPLPIAICSVSDTRVPVGGLWLLLEAAFPFLISMETPTLPRAARGVGAGAQVRALCAPD